MTRRRLAVAAVLVCALGLAVFAGRNAVVLWQMQRELRALERNLDALRAEREKLTRTVDRLRHDPAYLEQLAREDMGMVREGETVLKFPSQTPPPAR